MDYRGASTNLLDRVEDRIGESKGISFSVRPLGVPGDYDLVVTGRGGGDEMVGDALRVAFGRPVVLDVRGDRTLARVPDGQIERLGDELERRDPFDPLSTRNVLAGERWLVNFASANTTKALHAGHLRNTALGHGLASLAETGGARVVRQMRAGNIGRNMSEAVAGFEEAIGDSRTRPRPTEKGDKFVGRCYTDYVSGHEQARTAGRGSFDHALGRERRTMDDPAERLLKAWLMEDPRVVRRFLEVRDLALSGQRQTLDLLGVKIDRVLFESEFLASALDLVRVGMGLGLFRQARNGAVVYPTGDEEYPELLLTRSDGFPTQHLRYIAVWDALGAELSDVRTIGVIGLEWASLAKYMTRILGSVNPSVDCHPGTSVIHGMVGAAGGMHSSGGGTQLIDDLHEELMEAADGETDRWPWNLEQVAATVLLAHYMDKRVGRPLPFDRSEFLDKRKSCGWTLLHALGHALDPRFDGLPDPDPSDATYRFVAMQSQRYRPLLVRCLREAELRPLARYLFHLSRWYLGTRESGRVARLMRTILSEGMTGLGLLPSSGQESIAGTSGSGAP